MAQRKELVSSKCFLKKKVYRSKNKRHLIPYCDVTFGKVLFAEKITFFLSFLSYFIQDIIKVAGKITTQKAPELWL